MLTTLLAALTLTSVAGATGDVPDRIGRKIEPLWSAAVNGGTACAAFGKVTATPEDVRKVRACALESVCIKNAAAGGADAVLALVASGNNEIYLQVAAVRTDGTLVTKREMSVPANEMVRRLPVLAAQVCTALERSTRPAASLDDLDLELELEPLREDAERLARLEMDLELELGDLPPAPLVEAPMPAAPPPPVALAQAEAPALPPAALAPVERDRTALYVVGGAGLVGAAAAAVLGNTVLAAAERRDATRDRAVWRTEQDSVELLAVLTNVALSVGIGAALGAGALYATTSDAPQP